MKNKRIAAGLLWLLAAGFSLPVHAAANIGTYGFLRGTPAELFTDEDWKIFQESLNAALNGGVEGASRTWDNPNTGVSGEITVLRNLRQGGADCRRVRITNRARERQRTSERVFCEQADGRWKVASGRNKGR